MITPGELASGQLIAVIDGAPLQSEPGWHDREFRSFASIEGFFRAAQSTGERPPNLGRVLKVEAVNLPLILCTDVLTNKAAVFDARELRFREITTEFGAAYIRLFQKPETA